MSHYPLSKPTTNDQQFIKLKRWKDNGLKFFLKFLVNRKF